MSIAAPVAEPHVASSQGSDYSVGSNGRVRANQISEADRNCAVAMHLAPLAFFIVGPLCLAIPLVLWLVRKQDSPFNDDHGRETVNFTLSYLLWTVVFFWTFIIPIILVIVTLVNMIRGAVAAGNGEYFRYPMTIRFISS